jgi:hypothetical protein
MEKAHITESAEAWTVHLCHLRPEDLKSKHLLSRAVSFGFQITYLITLM